MRLHSIPSPRRPEQSSDTKGATVMMILCSSCRWRENASWVDSSRVPNIGKVGEFVNESGCLCYCTVAKEVNDWDNNHFIRRLLSFALVRRGTTQFVLTWGVVMSALQRGGGNRSTFHFVHGVGNLFSLCVMICNAMNSTIVKRSAECCQRQFWAITLFGARHLWLSCRPV